ncbi:MAG TPA: glycine--tRNA ligase subunit beta, partial [Burkholderiales bacterium]|nr:glycine--tRNA ligase subunit beta [Burkholderiales bacterium]
VTWFATPRRLAVHITEVLEKAPDTEVLVKGPSVKAGLDANGAPTPALLGFAKKHGVPVDALERIDDGKQHAFAHRDLASGRWLETNLDLYVEAALKRLPVAKIMRWGSGDAEFVRPVHGLILLHGGRIVPGQVLGIASGNRTRGHRFLGGELTIPHPDEYARLLEEKGAVVPGFEARMERIRQALEAAAGGARLAAGEDLLSEVSALVEFPVVYEGRFSEEFLAVPQQCLILSMKQHQKYFPLLDPTSGRLLPRFLIVSNLKTADPRNIVQGNERVLRARLSDAKFFFDHDRRTRLEERVPRLGQVVYHNRLGSQLERVTRIQKLAGTVARKLGADVGHAERAAWLCKADLLTDMVGEFPELQGIMGQYYAAHDGEPEAVSRAIEAHYHPRFAGDTLPEDNTGAAVALAEKLDTLVGIYGAAGAPTGDKDPFALRRHALGALRILAEKSLPLDLLALLQAARAQFPAEVIPESVALDVHQFMLERLRNYLRERDFQPDEIDAVVGQNPTRIDLVPLRLAAVREFKKLPEAASLAAANKRIQNILRKTQVPEGVPDLALMQEQAERALFAATAHLAPVVASLIENGDYTDALRALARARAEVDTFFEDVMVMTDEPLIRTNRLALLRQLGDLMNRVADISRLAA